MVEVEKTQYIKKPFFKRDPLTSIAWTLLTFFLSQLAAGLILSIYPSLKGWTADQGTDWLTNSLIAQFLFMLLAEAFAIWIVIKILKNAKVSLAKIGLFKPRLSDVGRALAAYGVYFVSYLVIIVVASKLSQAINVDQPQEIGFDSATGNQLYLVFMSLVILPPLAEEILFRGFLFSSLRQKFRWRYAAVFTSIFFGVAHLQFGSGAPLLWVAAIDTFVLSIVLCYLREKTGSVWAGIFLHALKNGVAFFALFHNKL